MEEKIKVSILLQIYGALLTENQLEVLNDYFNNDLSLSEIAENNGVTRQAVSDVINKSKNKLFEYEEKLLFMDRTFKQQKLAEEISEILKKAENKELSKNTVDKIIAKLKKIAELN